MNLNLPRLVDPKDLLDWARKLVDQVREHVDGAGLGFGHAGDLTTDNMRGVWIHYITNPVPDTEDALTHNLGTTPMGWILFQRDKPGILYNSGTPWTSTQMFLKCTVASTQVYIFVMPPSNPQF